jgi:CIC family chloride channel protein
MTGFFDRVRMRRAREQWETARFLGMAVIVGVLVGAGAALLIFLIQWVGDEVTRLPLGRWVPLVVLPLGILVAWAVANRWAPEVEGDGVPATIEGLAIRSGYLPTRAVFFKFIATALTLGTGGSGGREGPIVQVGATIGSSIARHTNLGEDQVRSLVAAGAGAAIGASFNAPIAGMLFAMEVILRTLSVRHLSAVVVASVAAAVTTKSLTGGEQILKAPPYGLIEGREWQELLMYAAVGIASALIAWGFLRMLANTERLSRRLPGWTRPLAIGLAIAAIGVIEPDVLSTGQQFVANILTISVSGTEVWWLLMLLVVLKMVVTSLTIESGGSGGAFMPSLFIGAAFGAGLAELLAPIWTLSPLRPGPFAVVGMAAMFAAVARAPLTSILIVFEITQDYKLIWPLMLAVSLATLITDLLSPESVYTMPLIRKGIRLVSSSEVDVLDAVKVGDVMSWQDPLAPHMTLAEAREILELHGHHGAAVLDQRKLIGILSMSDILRVETGTVADAMTARPVTVTDGFPVSEALERMAALGVSRLPVVSEDDPTHLVGMFRRGDVVKAYHIGLGAATGVQMARDRLRRRAEPGVSFFEVQVPQRMSGSLLKDVNWPQDCTLVSVRRRTVVYVPRGGTRLEAGDVVTVFGTAEAKKQLVELLAHEQSDVQ